MPDEVDDEPSFVVEEIMDSRWYGPKGAKFPKRFVQYMVLWAGYGPKENSWEPYEVLEGTAEKALQDYHSKYSFFFFFYFIHTACKPKAYGVK